MQIKDLLTVYRAQPFQPFVIHMADGRETRVDHPELMALSPTGRSVLVYGSEGAFEIIDLLLVTSVKTGNGKARSRRRKK